MGDNCAVCSVECTADKIICTTCKCAYHSSCAGLLPVDLECIKELNKRWQCPGCIQSGRKLRSGSGSSLSSAKQLAAGGATSLSRDVPVRSRSGSASSDSSTSKRPAASGGATLSQEAVDRLFTELLSIKSMQKSLVSEISSMKETQLQMREDINARFGEFQSELVICCSRLDEHDQLLASLSTAISDIDARVSGIVSDIGAVNALNASASMGNATLSNNSLSINDIMAEFSERQKRVKNIMLFGVTEAQGANNLEKDTADRGYVADVFSCIGVNPTISAISRVGTVARDRTRPLRVVLQSGDDVNAVVVRARRLRGHDAYKDVYISRDQTPRQQQLYKDVKRLLMTRRANGEDNLKIRMISGTPTIVSLN